MAGVNIVITVDGVLKHPDSDSPINEGLTFYRALIETKHRVILLTESLSKPAIEWLRHQRAEGFVKIYGIDPADLEQGTLLRTLARVRHTGRVDLLIDPDPGRCAKAFAAGYTVMPLLSPSFARPHWRPDYESTPRPWEELDAEVQRQRQIALTIATEAATRENP